MDHYNKDDMATYWLQEPGWRSKLNCRHGDGDLEVHQKKSPNEKNGQSST